MRRRLAHILLLNHDSSLNLNRRVLFAGLTAAKTVLIKRGKPPHALNVSLWKVLFHGKFVIRNFQCLSSNGQNRGDTKLGIDNWSTVLSLLFCLFLFFSTVMVSIK